MPQNGIVLFFWRLLLAGFVLLFAAPRVRAAEKEPPGLAEFALAAAGSDRGLCINLQAADAGVSIELARQSLFYVQGLACDAAQAEAARKAAAASPVAARVSVAWRRTAHLPYLDDLANVILAAGWGGPACQGLTLAEVLRVLRPGGVAIVGADNGVDAAKLLEEAGQLKQAQAVKLPRAGGWIKLDKLPNPDYGEWPNFAGSAELNMVAPDRAFAPGREVRWCNGARWAANNYMNFIAAGGRIYHLEREWLEPALGQWYLIARDAHNGADLWKEKMGGPGKWESNYVNPNMCADEKYIYMGGGDAVTAYDGATGKLSHKFEVKGSLKLSSAGRYLLVSGNLCHVIDKETRQVLWKHPHSHNHPPVRDGVAYFLNGTSVAAVVMADGKGLWTASVKEHIPNPIMLSIRTGGDAVYVQNGGGHVVAFEARTGQLRWVHAVQGKCSKMTVLPYADAVYLSKNIDVKGNAGQECLQLDPLTGKEVRVYTSGGYGARCWPGRGTERYIFGLNERFFLDRKSYAVAERTGVRPQCRSGPIVAYGLEYNAPHVCSCRTSLRGEVALSSGSACPKGEVAPAFFKGDAAAVTGLTAGPDDWPCYRGNGARASAIAAELPATLKLLWKAKLGAVPLPQATGAGSLVFAADAEAHRVLALDLATGQPKWTFVAEGRVGIAPSYHQGLCLFSDHAGWVYALDAASGRLAWKFHAAPEQKFMGAYNQFESCWPVRSGVLVLGNAAYFVAGRSSTMDGGLYLYALDAVTGQERWKRVFNDIRPTDILRTDGKFLFFGVSVLNPADGKDADAKTNGVLHSPPDFHGTISLLDMLAPSDPGQTYLRKHGIADGRGEGEHLAFDRDRTITGGGSAVVCKGANAWTNKSTAQAMQALLLAGPRVYAAGIPELRTSREPPALWILNAADGQIAHKLALESAPAVDGLSAVGGRLLLATVDGQLCCFGAP